MNKITVFEALESYQQVREQLDAGLFIVALLVALAGAYAAAGLYRFFYERRGTGSQVHRAFPLLGISITTLFIGVQLSIPLSLGLLGALSIIRFRTPIKEPEEVGFIMLVIAGSISAATFNFRFLAILYAIAIASLVITRGAALFKFLKRDGVLVLTLPSGQAQDHMSDLEQALSTHMGSVRMESASVRDGTASYQYVFSGLKCGVPALQAAIMAVAPAQSLNVFLDRPGGLR